MDKTILNDLTEYIEHLQYIPTKDIPSIALYMDQVTSFMEEKLTVMKRDPEDKALTKTMINNYAKNKLLPAPEKKRYSANHLIMLLWIYYFKGILSLSDIEVILRPLTTTYFYQKNSPTLTDIYEEVFSLEGAEKERLLSDLSEKFQRASESFPADAPAFSSLSDEQLDELRLFAFISELSYDVYLKKQLIEKLSDQLQAKYPEKKGRGK